MRLNRNSHATSLQTRSIGGHSAFGFKDNTYKVRQPLNLMNHVQLEDYINRILLLKEQWDVIQHTE